MSFWTIFIVGNLIAFSFLFVVLLLRDRPPRITIVTTRKIRSAAPESRDDSKLIGD